MTEDMMRVLERWIATERAAKASARVARADARRSGAAPQADDLLLRRDRARAGGKVLAMLAKEFNLVPAGSREATKPKEADDGQA